MCLIWYLRVVHDKKTSKLSKCFPKGGVSINPLSTLLSSLSIGKHFDSLLVSQGTTLKADSKQSTSRALVYRQGAWLGS